MMRDELVKLARQAAAGANRPNYCADPATFEPHEWVLEAMQRAYEEGLVEGAKLESERPF